MLGHTRFDYIAGTEATSPGSRARKDTKSTLHPPVKRLSTIYLALTHKELPERWSGRKVCVC